MQFSSRSVKNLLHKTSGFGLLVVIESILHPDQIIICKKKTIKAYLIRSAVIKYVLALYIPSRSALIFVIYSCVPVMLIFPIIYEQYKIENCS